MGNHEVPLLIENLFNWLLQMPPRIALAFEQIAGPSIVAALPESIANAGAVLAGNKNSHQKSNGSSASGCAANAEPRQGRMSKSGRWFRNWIVGVPSLAMVIDRGLLAS